MRSPVRATRRVVGSSGPAPKWSACGIRQRVIRQRISAAALTVVMATMLVVGSGIAGTDKARAAPMCPGPTTSDGLACCTAGSTPTGADTCQLPGGGVAASCALSQLTSSGTCCPASSSPQADGSCQPANGFASAPGCPLGQLGKSGLSCCPTGQVPQMDGSCQTSTAQPSTTQQPAAATPAGPSPCPPGYDTGQVQGSGGVCIAPYTCPAGGTLANPNLPGNGCCPAGTTAIEGACYPPGQTPANHDPSALVQPIAPICPPGSTAHTDGPNSYGGYFYTCTVPPKCPFPYVFSSAGGICAMRLPISNVTSASVGVSACPVGFDYSLGDDTNPNPLCYGQPIGCPAGTSFFNGVGFVPFIFGCCPPGTQAGVDGGFCVTTADGSLVDSGPPICPAGSTVFSYGGNTGVGGSGPFQWGCTAKPSCPARFVVDPSSGMCVLNPLQLQITPGQLQNLTAPPARPPSSGPCPAGDERAPDGRCVKIIPGALLPGCSAGYTMSPDGKTCVRAAGAPVGPAPVGPVGIPAGPKPIAPLGTPTTVTPTAKAPGETTSRCPPGESQVPGAKPGTCKSCPSGTHPNADGACVKTTTTTTPATTKTTSPTTKLTTPTRTISKPPKLLVTHPKPNLSPKPIARPRPPKKTPVEAPAKTTS